MKTEPENKDDTALRSLLREWTPSSELPPRFKDQVWHRIERAESAPGRNVSPMEILTGWIANILPRPALATAYITTLLVLGASVGWKQARQQSAQVASELGARYVHSVDPYQAIP